MKKGTIIWIVIVAVLFLTVVWGVKTYNGLVTAKEGVNAQWANVENQYQRRSDLIPNLVNTVKGYALHESSTFESVVSARAKATQVSISADELNPETMQKYQAAQGELSQALGRLLMITENYPDLKANQNFLELQAQLEGTENRISTERGRYNEESRKLNTRIKQFPINMIANMASIEVSPYFQAEEKAQSVPEVNF